MSRSKQIATLIGLAGAAGSASNAVSGMRAAKEDKDTLVLVNAAASAVVAITGALLVVRKLRKDAGK